MRTGLKIVSLIGLAATLLPSLIYLGGGLSHERVLWISLAGTIAWFASAPLWMGRELGPDADQVQI